MSESGASAAQNVSSFPMPPMQYVNLYSDENIRKGRAPKPPPPIKDSYSMFGIQFRADDQIIRPLENQGLRRLYPHNYDHKRELKKLNYSILVNFLDLLDILIKAPDSGKRCEKIDDLTLLFIHMHHLINEFRPHQARETLRVMLDLQNRQRFETLERFQLHVSHVKDIIQSSISVLPDDSELDSKLVVARPLALPFTSRDDAVSPSLNDVELDTDDLSYSGNEQNVYNNEALDEMMCGIVDNMT